LVLSDVNLSIFINLLLANTSEYLEHKVYSTHFFHGFGRFWKCDVTYRRVAN